MGGLLWELLLVAARWCRCVAIDREPNSEVENLHLRHELIVGDVAAVKAEHGLPALFIEPVQLLCALFLCHGVSALCGRSLG